MLSDSLSSFLTLQTLRLKGTLLLQAVSALGRWSKWLCPPRVPQQLDEGRGGMVPEGCRRLACDGGGPPITRLQRHLVAAVSCALQCAVAR